MLLFWSRLISLEFSDSSHQLTAVKLLDTICVTLSQTAAINILCFCVEFSKKTFSVYTTIYVCTKLIISMMGLYLSFNFSGFVYLSTVQIRNQRMLNIPTF